MSDPTEPKWLGLWRYAITFLVGVIMAAFTVGSARQRVQSLWQWKEEITPKIERMDSKGTLSFEHFEKSYYSNQRHTDDRLKELEKDVKELQRNKQ